MSGHVRRIIDDAIDDLWPTWPAVAIEGFTGVGKTTTASRRTSTTFEMRDPATRAALTMDSRAFDNSAGPVLVDDWTRDPHSYDVVRRSIGRSRTPGRFVLTADAQPLNPKRTSERDGIAHLRMYPMSLAERGFPDPPTVRLRDLLTGRRESIDGRCTLTPADYADEIVTSGLPGFRAANPAARHQMFVDLMSAVERDFTSVGRRVIRPGAFRRFLAAYLSAVGTSRRVGAIADDAAFVAPPTESTMIAYRDALTRLFVIDPILDWRKPDQTASTRGRQGFKHQVVDPAIAAHVLGLNADDLRRPPSRVVGKPAPRSMLGVLFESLVTASIRVYAQPNGAVVRHLGGVVGDRVIDLIVEGPDGRLVAFDTTLASNVHDGHVKNLEWLLTAIDPELVVDRVVVSAGDLAYRRDDGIAVVPAALLGP